MPAFARSQIRLGRINSNNWDVKLTLDVSFFMRVMGNSISASSENVTIAIESFRETAWITSSMNTWKCRLNLWTKFVSNEHPSRLDSPYYPTSGWRRVKSSVSNIWCRRFIRVRCVNNRSFNSLVGSFGLACLSSNCITTPLHVGTYLNPFQKSTRSITHFQSHTGTNINH